MGLPLNLKHASALEYFACLVADDTGFPLLEAAVSLAQDVHPELDLQSVLADVDELGQRLSQRVPRDAGPLQRLRQLNRYFFHELGFTGNVNHYHDPANSLLPRVLETRRGIPVSLAVLYMELAAHAGVPAQGVAFPGHFMVKFHMPQGEVVIDPFTGVSQSREALEERLVPYRRAQTEAHGGKTGMTGEDEIPLGLFLQAASPREIIARMLRNLKEIHRSALHWERLAQVQERLCVLLPQAWEEHRDLALVRAEMGQHGAAADALQRYLEHRPHAPDAATLRRHLAAWQRLH